MSVSCFYNLYPAYKLNYEELSRAMAEGIEFVENIEPVEIMKDEFGQAIGLQIMDVSNNKESFFPARTIIIAIGTTRQERIV